MKTVNKMPEEIGQNTTERPFWADMIINFALIISIMYGFVLIPYSVLKDVYTIQISVGFLIVISYVIFWGVQNNKRK